MAEQQFQQRTQKEKFEYHRTGEKRALAKLSGHTMTQTEKDIRSAGYMAHARESMRKFIWANAHDAEREAMKKLRKEKDKTKLWALEKVIKDRAKAEKEAAKANAQAPARGRKGA